MGKKILLYSALFIVASYFLFTGLVAAEAFLVPLITAMVLAFLVLPIANKLERRGWNKALSTIVSALALLVVVAGFTLMLFQQIRGFTQDWDDIQEKLEERLVDLSKFLEENTPLNNVSFNFGSGGEKNSEEDSRKDDRDQGTQGENRRQQEQDGDEQEGDEQEEKDLKMEEAAQAVGEQVVTTVGAVFGLLGYFLITFVYIFFFIYFRGRFREFILRFFPHPRRREVNEIISKASVVSRRYLAGRLFLMVILAGLYFAGLALSGLENALFIALISAALSIIPIVGNFIGFFIAVLVSLLTNGELGQIVGISITFIIAQFIDTYILQPIVLGDRVDVHPFFIILTVILGNEVWGVMGMVLAIPLFAIITVVCRHVPALNPFGYLFSKKDIDETEESKNEKRIMEENGE
jgi:predicted PurR-regulated permease PerM